MTRPDSRLPEESEEIIETLEDEHVIASGDVILVDGTTWGIRGEIAVDGEVIIAEFDDRAEAETALEQLNAARESKIAPS